jgi:hypothetical protein
VTEDEVAYRRQIGKRVRIQRVWLDLSQEEVAVAAGVTRNFVSLWNAGRRASTLTGCGSWLGRSSYPLGTYWAKASKPNLSHQSGAPRRLQRRAVERFPVRSAAYRGRSICAASLRYAMAASQDPQSGCQEPGLPWALSSAKAASMIRRSVSSLQATPSSWTIRPR